MRKPFFDIFSELYLPSLILSHKLLIIFYVFLQKKEEKW